MQNRHKKYRSIGIAIAIIALMLLAACEGATTLISNTNTVTVSYGGTWYVDENGNDSNDGLSADTPVATLNKALSLVRGAYSRADWPGTETNPKAAHIIVSGTIAKDDFEANDNGMVYIDNSTENAYPPLVIEGNAAKQGTINAGGEKRVLYADNTNITLRILTLTGGNSVSYYDDQGNYYDGSGGGVFVTGSNITIDGGQVIGNTGMGVALESGSTLSMLGESVVAGNIGVGVYASGYSRLNLHDRASISNNTGGGVKIFSRSRLSMYEEAAIKDNSATGVDCTASAFIMNGGVISGNTGSGVYVAGSGGKYVTVRISGAFIMNGGTIADNSAICGGGVCLDGGGKYGIGVNFTMNGGFIANNTASTGGGVGFTSSEPDRCDVTINRGLIADNTADEGGGVYAHNFSMSGGAITRNTARSNGGGVYTDSFTMTGGSIADNTADEGGGVHAGNFSMSGGSIMGNTAHRNGGGIYSIGQTFTKTGSSFIDGYSSGNNEKKNKVKNSEGIQDNAGHAVYLVYDWEYDENNEIIPISTYRKEYDCPLMQDIFALGSFLSGWDY